jgi:hypothetical protein
MSDEVKVLSRADFIAATQMKREAVPVPELGGTVFISQLYAAQLLDYNEYLQQLKRDGATEITPSISLELMARLVSLAACDETGVPLFTESDVKELTKSHPGVLLALSTKAMELSGLSSDAVKEVAEQLKKNQNDASSTNSPRSSTGRRRKSNLLVQTSS